MLLSRSEFMGTGSLHQILELARGSKGEDYYGYRAEFIKMIEKLDLEYSTRPDSEN